MWKFPVYNYTERQPFTFNIERIFTGSYLQAFEEFITYYAPDVVATHPTKYPKLSPREQRVCRFCKKSAGEVTFRKNAHVIPQCLGNRYLIHDIECDNCNFYFGKFETSFADSIGIFRTADGVEGQRGIPTFKNHGLKAYLDGNSGENTVSIDISPPTKAIWDKEKDSITFSASKKYVPLHVMKILYKIGYSLLSKEEIPDYLHIDKIITTNIFDGKLQNYCKVVKFIFPYRYAQFPSVITYKKRPEYQSLNMPTKVVVLYFGRFMYEFVLLNSTDTFMIEKGGKGKCLFVPPYWESQETMLGQYMIDLSNPEPKSETETVTFTFDRAK